ncbi:UNVERIFIED_CONTAM: Stress-response A/B barrel domain-containing protein UP3 [Sesamum latifolium]|uniref:Stress-response A/B barrel domain-containing protein UP3 n=1 Tax=Sesamum latifolium TaxID=2727402 RepID=A0AAW2VAM0_9LAMI
MLSVTAAARTHFPFVPHLRHSAALRRKPSISHCRFPLRSSSSIRMSSSDSHSNSNQIIEHIVLFKVKPETDPYAVNAMITNLNGLSSLDPVLHISAGPVSRCRSNSLTFTHMLHSRYRTKTDLTAYSEHPAHVSVVSTYIKPIIEDIMAVDWVAEDFSRPADVPPGEKFPSIEQLTAGENFSPGRAKGFSIGSIAVFKGMKELEELDSESELANEQKDKVREFLDGVLVLDYAVAASVQTASV